LLCGIVFGGNFSVAEDTPTASSHFGRRDEELDWRAGKTLEIDSFGKYVAKRI
jgi:hypothetical protein